MKRTITVFCLSVCMLLCTSTYASKQAGGAQLRLLLRFDESGHHVEKLFRTPHSKSMTGAQRQLAAPGEFPDIDVLSNEVEPGSASLVWLNEQGYVISVTTAPDPRVSHSPAHIAGVDESRVFSQSGAWLVNGPAEAADLLILLPENLAPPLAQEQWNVHL